MSTWRGSLGACAVGVAVLLVGLVFAPREALGGILAGLLGVAVLPLGALALGLGLALVDGSARDMLWPRCLLVARAMPWLVPMALPLLLGAGALYGWANADYSGFRGAWLSQPGFAIRGAIYLALWIGLARWVLPLCLARQELAGIGLILLVPSLSAAAVDWGMSLDADFSSAIFGLLWLARALLGGIALCSLLALRAGAPRPGVLRGLLAAALLLWLYLHFMQYLIVWYGNLPHEIHWYQVRGAPGWFWLGALLYLGQGMLFALLLLPGAQRPRRLAGLAWVSLALGLADGAWLSLPSVEQASPLWLGLCSVAAWLAFGGLLASFYGRRRAQA